ncbi:MAG: hypothetical protein AB7F59_03945 [Bdellovibrionales bacterium]
MRWDQQTQGQWKGRALVRDLVAKKTNVVRIDLIAQRPQKLRADFSASLGIYLGTLTMNERELSFLIKNQKTLYRGSPQSEKLSQLTPFPLSPRQLMRLLFDQEPDDWKCVRDEKSFLKECMTDSHLKISWTKRQDSRRTVTILGRQFEIQLDLSGSDSPIPTNDSMFLLTVPAGFAIKKI